jgi:hypothetical protein
MTDTDNTTEISNNNTDSKKRQQISEILGIDIPPARCLVHIKKYLNNKNDEEEEKELKNKKKQLITQKNDKSITPENKKEVEDEIKKINQAIKDKNILRISSDMYIAIAVICNYFVEEIVKCSIDEIVNNNIKKVIDVPFVINSNLKTGIYYPFYNKLPLFIDYQNNYETIKKNEIKKPKKKKESDKVIENNTENNDKNIKVDKNDKNDKIKDNKTDKDDVVVDTDNSDENKDAKTKSKEKEDFNAYVKSIYKKYIKKELPEDKKQSINQVIYTFLSDLIIECIKKLITLVKVITQYFISIRTINSNHIKAIVCMYMKIENKNDEDINNVLKIIDEKVKLHQEHNKDKNKKYKKESNDEEQSNEEVKKFLESIENKN